MISMLCSCEVWSTNTKFHLCHPLVLEVTCGGWKTGFPTSFEFLNHYHQPPFKVTKKIDIDSFFEFSWFSNLDCVMCMWCKCISFLIHLLWNIIYPFVLHHFWDVNWNISHSWELLKYSSTCSLLFQIGLDHPLAQCLWDVHLFWFSLKIRFHHAPAWVGGDS
jgi:hypothetical protein